MRCRFAKQQLNQDLFLGRTLGVTRNLADRKPARALEKFRVEINQHRPQNSFALGSGRVQSLAFKFRCRENSAGLTAVGPFWRETASRHVTMVGFFYRSDDRLVAWGDAFAVAIL